MPEDLKQFFAVIKVVGVGGGGNNAINRMIRDGMTGVDFIAVNTDAQDLLACDADVKISIGEELTHFLGTGNQPEVGRDAAEEHRDEIKEALKGSDMVFITAGEGGGTGTGAAPVVAELARELGALTIGVVTKPFEFEGTHRKRQAEEGVERLQDKVDTLIIIPNDKLFELTDSRISIEEAFRKADEVLRYGVQGITDLINIPGLINLDFADVKKILSIPGSALLGVGEASGEDRAIKAAENAVSSPLLESSIDGAQGVIVNVTGGPDMTLQEQRDAAEIIRSACDPDSEMIFGVIVDPVLHDKIKVTVIASGIELGRLGFARPSRAAARRRVEGAEEDVERDIERERKSRERERERPSKTVYEEEDITIPPFLRNR
ncbi:MAG: cell division protein FtsZ [Actinobacteria bacterium]|nr:cell division protein FtsZ [Actinomycetota bacterium]MBU1944475.1 cell division protein FtsZ [Actinomycetota bacterium]MBU2688640.1 cell division protein FtsZ [Actinomycetota bacterium]